MKKKEYEYGQSLEQDLKDEQDAAKEGFDNPHDYYNERANRLLAKRAKLKVIKIDRELAEYLRDICEAEHR